MRVTQVLLLPLDNSKQHNETQDILGCLIDNYTLWRDAWIACISSTCFSSESISSCSCVSNNNRQLCLWKHSLYRSAILTSRAIVTNEREGMSAALLPTCFLYNSTRKLWMSAWMSCNPSFVYLVIELAMSWKTTTECLRQRFIASLHSFIWYLGIALRWITFLICYSFKVKAMHLLAYAWFAFPSFYSLLAVTLHTYQVNVYISTRVIIVEVSIFVT